MAEIEILLKSDGEPAGAPLRRVTEKEQPLQAGSIGTHRRTSPETMETAEGICLQRMRLLGIRGPQFLPEFPYLILLFT